MNSQLRHIKDNIHLFATGEVGAAMELLIEMCTAFQSTLREQELSIKDLEDQNNHHNGNSSMSPSSDTAWWSSKKRSLREPTNKSVGGQKGHTRQGVNSAIHRMKLFPLVADVCPHNTHDLSGVKISAAKIKQRIEPAPITPTVTEYQLQVKCCPQRNASVQSQDCPIYHQMEFGPPLKTFCVYLSVYQLVPCQRTAELLQGVLGIAISTGNLDNFRMLEPFVNELKQTIRTAEAAYFDETGIRVNGKRIWAHTTLANTPFTRRINNVVVVLIIEWTSYLVLRTSLITMHYLLNNVFTEAEHSLCNTYVLRELNGVLDREREGAKSEWAAKLKFLLKEANVSVNPIEKARLTIKAQKDYRQEYKKIVKEGLVFHPHQPKPKTQKRGAAKQTKTRNLLLRLQKRRDNYLLFLKEPTASFTNNQAEQDLRMLKVKTKISGCFKSMTASQQFRLLDRILVRLPNRDLI